MNLIIDIGNTATKYSVYSEEKEILGLRMPDADIDVIKELRYNYPTIKHAILSATGEVPEAFESYVQNHIPYYLRFNQQTPIPFKSHYKTQHTLGLDRIAAVAGALKLYTKKDVLIIDAGTAITYDFVDAEENYLGGNISPGLAIRFKALHDYTHKLPLLEPVDLTSLTGTTTEEAIQNGVINGIVHEIEGTIEQFRLNYKNLTVLLTGGDAQFFDNKLKKTIFVVQNLVSTGLNTILNYNVENN